MTFSRGQLIGPYVLDGLVGVGGSAEVWAATHSLLRVQVAIKMLAHDHATLRHRLLQEGRVQAALDHPNLLPVRDVVEVGDAVGLVLPLVRGPSLKTLLSQHRLHEPDAIALFDGIVQGVAHAHQHGWVHRDLKPGNVLLESKHGRIVPRVADFGLVKAVAPSAKTQPGVMVGTFGYAAPEQLRDASGVDQRADLFSLGVMLVELLSGRQPFSRAHRHPPDLPGVPRRWRALCRALLARSPDDRPADGEAVRDALNREPIAVDSLATTSQLGQAIRQLPSDIPQRSWASTLDPSEPRPVPSELPHSARTRTVDPSGLDAEGTGGLRPVLRPVGRLVLDRAAASLRDGFVGRADALHQLDDLLRPPNGTGRGGLTVVTGALLAGGGFGKSRLALEYLWRYQPLRFPGGAFWLDADVAREGLEAQWHAVLRTFVPDLPPLAQLPALGRDVAAELDEALRRHADEGPFLVVLDNVPEPRPDEAPASLDALFPGRRWVTVLATSRRRIDEARAATLAVDVLDPGAARQLLLQHVLHRDGVTDPEWDAVAAWVGRLPLALELLNRVLVHEVLLPRELCDAAREQSPVQVGDAARDALRGHIADGALRGIREAFQARASAFLAPAPLPRAGNEWILRQAAKACRAALQIRTREAAPLRWAKTRTNLGTALSTLGRRTEHETTLQQAANASGIVVDRGASPIEAMAAWAELRVGEAAGFVRSLIPRTNQNIVYTLMQELGRMEAHRSRLVAEWLGLEPEESRDALLRQFSLYILKQREEA